MKIKNAFKNKNSSFDFINKIFLILFCFFLFSIPTYRSFAEEIQSARLPIYREPRQDSLLNYQVQKGDNLYYIAKKYFAQTDIFFFDDFIEEIKKINEIPEDNLILPYQILKIPISPEVDSVFYQKIQHNELRGLYLNTYQLTTERLKEIIENFDSLGLNALVVDFKNTHGDILYPTKNSLAIKIGACKPVISYPNRLIYQLHKHNISLIARITIFKDTTLANASASTRFIGTPPRSWRTEWTPKIKIDSIITDSSAVDSIKVNKIIKWVNPNCEEVQNYNLDIIEEVISLGVDEIQLDYIRFPTETYLLNADYGIPDSVSKQEVITNFVKKVYSITKKNKIKLSADIFGVVALQNEQDIINTGQNIKSILPYLDRIHPMVYPSHFFGEFWNKKYPADEPYYFVYRTCQTLLNQIEQKKKIIPYLQAFTLERAIVSPLYIISQLQAIKDCGLDSGYLLWNASGNYDSAWNALNLWNSKNQFQIIPEIPK